MDDKDATAIEAARAVLKSLGHGVTVEEMQRAIAAFLAARAEPPTS